MKGHKLQKLLIFKLVLISLIIIVTSSSSNIKGTNLPKSSASFSWNWNQRYGLINRSINVLPDYGRDVIIDSEGNIYVTGFTLSYGAGEFDIFLLKYSENGAQIWNHTWGGINHDYGVSLSIDTADNIYIAGHTESFGSGISSMVLIKFNKDGDQLWNVTRNGGANSIKIDSMGNIYLAGTPDDSISDLFLVKFDPYGVELWNRTWATSGFDVGNAVALDSLDNVYLAGDTENPLGGDLDMVLIKYNEDGVELWNQTWGGDLSDVCNDIIVDSENNIYISGSTSSFGQGNTDFIIVKFDENGKHQWNSTWGDENGDRCKGMCIDENDDIYLTGFSDTFTGDSDHDLMLIKYDITGELEWNVAWNEEQENEGYDVIIDTSNNAYIVGDVVEYGNFGNQDVIILSLTIRDDTNNLPRIGGYNLYSLIGVFGIAIITLLRRKYLNSS